MAKNKAQYKFNVGDDVIWDCRIHGKPSGPERRKVGRVKGSWFWLEGDDRVTDRNLVDSLLTLAGARDGDEVVFSVQLTSSRPFGNRRMVLTEPHTYERETEEEAEDREAAERAATGNEQ